MRYRTLIAIAVVAVVAVVAAGCSASAKGATTDPATTATTRPASTSTRSITHSTTTVKRPARAAVDICAFRGLGTWVDVYDYVPDFAENGRVAPVKPDDILTDVARGVAVRAARMPERPVRHRKPDVDVRRERAVRKRRPQCRIQDVESDGRIDDRPDR